MNVKWFSYHVEKVFFAHITSPGDTQVWEQPAWTPASTACSSQHTYKPHVKDRYSEKGKHLQCKQNQIKAFCQFKTSSSKKKCIKFPEVQTCCSIKTPTQSQNRQICKSFNSSLLLYLNCASVYQSKCLALLQKLAGFTKQGGKTMSVSKTSKSKSTDRAAFTIAGVPCITWELPDGVRPQPIGPAGSDRTRSSRVIIKVMGNTSIHY